VAKANDSAAAVGDSINAISSFADETARVGECVGAADSRGDAMFTECKAAQMAAHFLNKEQSKGMPFIKLVYLAGCQHYDDNGFSISDDAVFAMEHGLVFLQTYNEMTTSRIAKRINWQRWAQDIIWPC
jgi:hypothetical protein